MLYFHYIILGFTVVVFYMSVDQLNGFKVNISLRLPINKHVVDLRHFVDIFYVMKKCDTRLTCLCDAV